MTLDEAIKYCDEIKEAHDILCKRYDDASGYSRSHNDAIRKSDAKEHEKCSQDFKQITQWLKELKAYKEQEPCNSCCGGDQKEKAKLCQKSYLAGLEHRQEPCKDAISRKAALEAILTSVPDFCGSDEGGNLINRNETASYIRNLPSIIPKQKTGEILTDYEIYTDKEGFERRVKKTTRCSLCSCDLGWNGDLLTHYCPNCGVKLEYKGR